MARPWFGCEPVDESFFETAPVRLSAGFEVPRPGAEVWGELTADDALHWCRLIQNVTWTSSRPFGVGTTREVKALWGANLFRERYFRWEEGHRHSFYVVESTAPLTNRFAEDYLVEPRGESACRFTWTIAFEPKTLAVPGVPVNKLLLRTLFIDTRDHYGLG